MLSPFHSLARLALFVCGFAAVAAVTDALLVHGLRRVSTGSFGVWNRVVRGEVDADLLVSGSSRALVHYDPRILGEALGVRAFNLGRDGTLPDLQLAFLETYLRTNRAPRIVVQNLDLSSLTPTTEIYQPGQYVPYLDQPEIYGALERIAPWIWRSRWIPLYGFNRDDMQFVCVTGFLGLFGIPLPENRFDGFEPRFQTWTSDFDRFRRSNPDGTRKEVTPEGRQVLERLVELCKNRGIHLVFVYSPEYYENYPLIINRQDVIGTYQAIASRHGLPFWDYSGSPITKDVRFFYNSQHLNAEGARLFSRDLSDRLLAHAKNLSAL